MKKKFCFFAVLAITVFSAFKLITAWKADEKSCVVSWELADGSKKGTFSNLKTEINFEKTNLPASKIIASIDVKTIKAGNEELEAHLLTADFFDAEKFPTIVFTSSEITKDSLDYIAKGTLKMKDSTKVINLPFKFEEINAKNGVFKGIISVNASDYGVTRAPKKPEGDKVNISLTVPISKD